MTHLANPAGADLQAFLAPVADALRITLPKSLDYQGRIDAARLSIEGQAGRTLLAVSQTRKFDPPTNPRGVIDLGADLLSVASLLSNGVTLVADTDYVLGPYNADINGKPFRWIQFLTRNFVTGLRRSVVITGVWGLGTALQAQAWDAILCQGAINCYPELALAVSRGLQMRHEGDVEEMYARGKGNGPLLEEMGGWQLRVTQAIENLLVVEVGLS